MKNKIGLGRKLWRAFVGQAILISLAAILSVYAARFVLGDVLIKQALEQEANYFWQKFASNQNIPRPDTNNLHAYLVPGDPQIPPAWLELSPGFHKLPSETTDISIVHVSKSGAHRLFLQFDGASVNELAFWFGFVPLIAVLISIYLASWLAYRFSKRALSPVIGLAAAVAELDPGDDQSFARLQQQFPEAMDQEVATLSRALSELALRVGAFVERERAFTRDASHELRSPITVIKLTTEVLLADTDLDASVHRAASRIKRNASDMEELIEALLLLAREADHALSSDIVCVNDIVAEEVERAQMLNLDKSIELVKNEQSRLFVTGNDRVVSVLVGNIIRNAFSYTDEGRVSIEIEQKQLRVQDSGIGISNDEVKQIFKTFLSCRETSAAAARRPWRRLNYRQDVVGSVSLAGYDYKQTECRDKGHYSVSRCDRKAGYGICWLCRCSITFTPFSHQLNPFFTRNPVSFPLTLVPWTSKN